MLEDDSYAQGYMLLRAAAKKWMESEPGRHCADVARRVHHSQPISGKIKEAYDKNPGLENLLLDSFFRQRSTSPASWRKAQIHAIELGVPTPAFPRRWRFFDGFRTGGCRRTCCKRSVTFLARTL